MSQVTGGQRTPTAEDSPPGVRGRLGRCTRFGLRLCAKWALSAWSFLTRRRRRYNILSIELSGDLTAPADEEGLRGLFRLAATDFLTLVAVLKWAQDDPRVEIVRLTIGRLAAGWALLDELRRSIAGLRKAGKTVWAYSLEPGLKEYYLGSAADRVLLPPASLLDVTGLASEITFIKGALAKLGIEAQITQVGRYKSLGEMFTRGEMSGPHREMVESVIDDLYRQVVSAIAASRGAKEESIAEFMRGGPYTGTQALEKGFVDALVYEDELVELARREVGEPQVIKLRQYRRQRGLEMRKKLLETDAARVAVLDLSGPVKMGNSIPSAEGVRATGARSFGHEVESIRNESRIKGVVIRVNSPGGSALASDLMWRAVMKLREEKPVVVSFGEVAASGGYYVGMAGNRVLCEGTTITGSIGVLAGKAVLKGLYDQVGIRKEIVSRGGSPSRHSDYLPLDEESAARMVVEAESFYEDFVAKVAECREMNRVDVSKRAEGRVWSGRQAVENGLADETGGIEQAIDRLKEMVGVPSARPVAVERFPRGKKWLRLQLGLSPFSGVLVPVPPGVSAMGWLVEAFSTWWRGERVIALAAIGPALASVRPTPAASTGWFRGSEPPLWRRLAAVLGGWRPPSLPF